VKICPVCRDPLHTTLDEISHEEAHKRRGIGPKAASVRLPERGDSKGKAPPEIVVPGASGDVFHHVAEAKNTKTVTERKKHCPTCSCLKVYSSHADRQRAYRERKANGVGSRKD